MARRRLAAVALAAFALLVVVLGTGVAVATPPGPIPGYELVAPLDGATIPRSLDLQFQVHAQPHLLLWVAVSSAPALVAETGAFPKESWVMPLPSWPFPHGSGMSETSSGTYTFAAYASAFPFLIRPGTYYWQVTALSRDSTTSGPQPFAGPVHELTITGPEPVSAPPASGQGAMWGGPTSMGFPGQRTPIAFRVADSQSVSDLSYAGVQFCSGIPDSSQAIGGHLTDVMPLSPEGSFTLMTQRVSAPPPNGAGMTTVLSLAGTVRQRLGSGTLAEDAGRDCHSQASWTATPALAGATSQGLPVVALSARRHRIDRLMLVWSSNCLRSQVTNPKAWETLWLDLKGVKVDRRTGAFRLRRVFRLRNSEGDVFRVSGDLRGILRKRLSATFRARARNSTPLRNGVSETQTERCDSGPVSFNVTR